MRQRPGASRRLVQLERSPLRRRIYFCPQTASSVWCLGTASFASGEASPGGERAPRASASWRSAPTTPIAASVRKVALVSQRSLISPVNVLASDPYAEDQRERDAERAPDRTFGRVVGDESVHDRLLGPATDGEPRGSQQ